MSKELVAVTVGQKYSNYKSKKVASVASVNKKEGSAKLVYEDGKSTDVSFTTLTNGKSWKLLTKEVKKMQDNGSDEEQAKQKLKEMLAGANEIISETDTKAKAKVKEEVKAKEEAAKKAEAEDAERLAKEEAAEKERAEKEKKEENELLSRYQKNVKAKKQENVEKEKPEKQEKVEKPKKEKKEKKEKKVKEDVERVVTADFFKDYIQELGGTVVKGSHEYYAKKGKKTFALYNVAQKNTKVTVKVMADVCNIKPDEVSKYQFCNRYYFKAEDAKAVDTIKKILAGAYKAMESKTTNKKKED